MQACTYNANCMQATTYTVDGKVHTIAQPDTMHDAEQWLITILS